MSIPIATSDDVTVRDPRQIDNPSWRPGADRGTWTVREVRGVAAVLARSPLSVITVITPVSNLRRMEVTR